jgi:hypothetical protein
MPHPDPTPSRMPTGLRDMLCLLPLAGIVYFLQCLAWPLSRGRDYGSYITYYLNYFDPKPVFQTMMLYRTPLSPLFYGLFMEHVGVTATEVVIGVIYVLTIAAFYRIGLFWGRVPARVFAVTMIFFPDFAAQYHSVSSDALFSSVFYLWLMVVCMIAGAPTLPRFAAAALVFFLLILARPSSQIYIILTLFPLLLPAISWQRRAAMALVYFVGAVAAILLWSSHNYYRYGDFTVSRTSNAQVPLARVYIKDKLTRPDNGKYSRELADLVERELLTREPYVSYQIDIDTFFTSGNPRMYFDLVGLSDEFYGWDADHEIMRKVALEALWRYPGPYIQGVWDDSIRMFGRKYYRYSAPSETQPFRLPSDRSASPDRDSGDGDPDEDDRPRRADNADRVIIGGRSLPRPTEGQLIPRSHLGWLASSSDQSVYIDWSDIDNPVYRFKDPEVERLHDAMAARDFPGIPVRKPNEKVARVLNKTSRYVYPIMWAWIFVGFAGMALRFDFQARVLAFIFLLAFGSVLLPIATGSTYIQYRLPFDPVFILMGTVGYLKIGAWVVERLRRPT